MSAHNNLRPVSMQTTTSQATSGNTTRADYLGSSLPMLTKYAKIQPAVAIKPKPVGGVATSAKSSFNPQYDPQASASTFFSDDQAGNINVLRKWVLPARPRPGRKPVANTPPATGAATATTATTTIATGAASPVIEESRGLAKKRFKCTKPPTPADSNSLPPPYSAGSPGGAAATITAACKTAGTLTNAGGPIGTSVSGKSGTSKTSGSTKPLTTALNGAGVVANSAVTTLAVSGEDMTRTASGTGPIVNTPSKQVVALQEAYLAKLKEQELINNYIDTLLNQINELRFVQSGMITADALSSINDVKKTAPTLQTPDQLDHINNVRDLEKFLAHLTTQANIIHSVTKKYIDEGSAARNPIQLQIEHYLRLRQRSRDKSCASATNLRLDAVSLNAGFDSSSRRRMGPLTTTRLSPEILTTATSRSDPIVLSSTFTPSLLRPLDIDLFDQEDDIIGVEPLEGEFFEKLKNSDDPELEFAPILKQASTQGRKRLGCGFCSGETPCLCFEADNIFGDK